MLTKNDLLQIDSAINKRVNPLEEKMEEKFEKIEDRIKLLPTKDEFFEKMSDVMGELKAIREQQEIITGKTSDHEDRLVALEQLHPELQPTSL